MMRSPIHARLVFRDQSIRYNQRRRSRGPNWRQLRLVGGWCLLVSWASKNWRGA